MMTNKIENGMKLKRCNGLLRTALSFASDGWLAQVTQRACLLVNTCFVVSLSIAIMLAGFGCGKNDATASKHVPKETPICIGVILPLTGEASSYGVDCRKGVELAASLSESRVQFIFEDSKAEPKQAVSAMQRLITQKKVIAVIGDMFSSTTLAIAPIAQEEGIILLTPTAAAIDIPATGDKVFTIYPSSKFEGEFMAQYALKAGVKRLGIMVQQFQAAEELATAFSKTYANSSGLVAYTEIFPTGTRDFRSLIASIKTKPVDAIFISAYGQEASLFVQQSREAGFNPLFLSQSSLYDQKLLADFASILEGTVFSAPFFTEERATPKVIAFRNAYKTKYGMDPSVWAAYGYDSASLIMTAIAQQIHTGKPLHSTIQGISMDGTTGPLSFNPDRTARRSMSSGSN